jgi:hypothetical protein
MLRCERSEPRRMAAGTVLNTILRDAASRLLRMTVSLL